MGAGNDHATRREAALSVIRFVHADTSVDLNQTKESLEELRDTCDELIEAVNSDIEANA